jgi:hypothetical protein
VTNRVRPAPLRSSFIETDPSFYKPTRGTPLVYGSRVDTRRLLIEWYLVMLATGLFLHPH